MRNFRGLTKDGKDSRLIYGNLIVNNARESDGIHEAESLRTYIRERDMQWRNDPDDKCWTYIVHEVIPESVAQQVGLKDKNGDEIYEGDKIAFNVNKQFGTNKRYEGRVYFCKTRLSYCVDSSSAWDMPISRNLRDIEIIPPEAGEKPK